MRRRHDIPDPADFDLLPAHPQAEHAYHAHAAGAKGNARATEDNEEFDELEDSLHDLDGTL
jgi:hypothetical protein